MKNILETIMHIGILEENSTNVGRSQFMTVSCVISEWCEQKNCYLSVEKV